MGSAVSLSARPLFWAAFGAVLVLAAVEYPLAVIASCATVAFGCIAALAYALWSGWMLDD